MRDERERREKKEKNIIFLFLLNKGMKFPKEDKNFK